MRKNYILDANILIHDPNSIFQFADNTVIIPVAVIGEIDRFKKEMTDRGYNARAVVRLLDSLRGSGPRRDSDGAATDEAGRGGQGSAGGQSLAGGIPLQNGGILKVYCEPERLMTGSNGHGDIEILRVAQAVQRDEPDTPVIIVTKDINLRIRADAAGFRAEDYESDHVLLSDLYSGEVTETVTPEQIGEFRSTGRLPMQRPEFLPNEYVLLRADNGSKQSALGRVDVDCRSIIALREPAHTLWGLRPRNKEQYFAIDALLDERIQLVTLMGKAGTGKTLLALAAALHLTIVEKKYRGIIVGRPIFPLGRDIGYLPGDIEQKLDPWMKPIIDTVDFLLDLSGPVKGFADCAAMLRNGIIEIQPLTYIRGRSIANRFVVIDEAQNLTPLEVKTVITRVGQDSKIVLTGDPYQIDNPYVDGNSNGFTYLVNRFRTQSLAAHVQLRKGERSPLAELAANLL